MKLLNKDVPPSGCIQLGWVGEEVQEDPEAVTGSVVEFAFGPVDNSYVATSYPYRPHYAKDDPREKPRSIATLNLPQDVCKKIRTLRPRYIMHIAFRREPYTWLIYCYRGSRYAYDSKWQPRKPNTADGSLGERLDNWKEDECDQISYCSFGDGPGKWFMRSTNDTTEWQSECGPAVPYKLWKDLEHFKAERKEKPKKDETLEPAKVSTVRAATLGAGKAWILYSQDDFVWSEDKELPPPLVKALHLGKDRETPWRINKAVLNPFNRHEFVLVYDNGRVYCSFHPHFLDRFKLVIQEWAESKGHPNRDRVQYYPPAGVTEAIADISDDGDSFHSADNESDREERRPNVAERESDEHMRTLPSGEESGYLIVDRSPELNARLPDSPTTHRYRSLSHESAESSNMGMLRHNTTPLQNQTYRQPRNSAQQGRASIDFDDRSGNPIHEADGRTGAVADLGISLGNNPTSGGISGFQHASRRRNISTPEAQLEGEGWQRDPASATRRQQPMPVQGTLQPQESSNQGFRRSPSSVAPEKRPNDRTSRAALTDMQEEIDQRLPPPPPKPQVEKRKPNILAGVFNRSPKK